jgi:hypothetical protein
MPPTVTDLAENNPLSLMRLAAASTFLDAIDGVEGWLLPTTALAMIEVLWAQERLGALGDIAEIGGWDDKSLLALAAGARPGDRLLVIGAVPRGTGCQSMPRADLALFFPGVQPVIVEASSASLVNDTSARGTLRFLSIGGGHARAHSPDDLRLADARLTEQGVCWLDVFKGAGSVTDSITRAHLDSAPELQPLALFPGKLMLARPSMAETWRTQLRNLFARAIDRQDVELHRVHIDLYKEVWPELAPALRISDLLSRSAAERRISEAEAALSAYTASAAAAERRASVAEAALPAAERRALEAEAAFSATELRALEAETALLACKTSTSWRITSPLRVLAAALRR